MKMNRLISYVIPCYGSEKTIRGVVQEIQNLYPNKYGDSYEIILVNDSSPDNVIDVIQALVNENDNIIGVDLARNFGQHAALFAGYSYAKGDLVVSLDDDGQIAVEDTYKLIEHLDQGYDVVYGKYKEKKHSWIRNLFSKMAMTTMSIFTRSPKNFHSSSFYVARKYVIQEMFRYKNSYVYLGGLVFRATDKVDSIYVGHRARKEGKSGYTFIKLFSLWFNSATTFSVKPLRMSAVLGSIIAIIGMVCACVVVVRKIIYVDIEMGWSSLMAVTLLLCGTILIVLGLLGEYVGRLYMSSNAEPQYVIRDVINKDTSK